MNKKQKRIDTIREFLTSYSPESVFVYLQAAMCHPANQKFVHRFEYLIAELLSIPGNSFSASPVTRLQFESFLDSHADYLNRSFSQIEDFEGFDQTKLIPFFWNQDRYYFFYSLYERPYESWKELTDAMTGPDFEDYPEFLSFKNLLALSLELQTSLLVEICDIGESNDQLDSMYLPSQGFIDRISMFFKNTFDGAPSIKLGQLKNAGRENLIRSASQMGKFITEFNLEINGKQYIIYPQVHLQILLRKAKELILAETRNQEAFMDNFRYRLAQITRSVFKRQNEIFALLAESHEEEFLEGIADHTFWYDSNKLVLFKAVNFCSGRQIAKEINTLILQIEKSLQKIGKENAVGIFRGRKERMLGLVVENLEIHIVLVYQSFDLSYALYLKENKVWEKAHLFSMMDMRAILENLTMPIDFLKFLEEEKYLVANATLSKYDEFQDRFVWFLRNNNSYITMGAETEVIHFPAHRWSLSYAEKMYRYLNTFYDIHYEVEQKFPNTFSVVEEYRENVYSLTDPIDFETTYVSKLPGKFVWVYLPNDPLSLDYNEFWSGASMFAPMFADYIALLGHGFSTVLDDQNISEFDILIAPSNFLIRDKEHFPFLQEHLVELNERKPYKFVTLPIGIRHVRTFFIFEFQHCHSIFNSDQNEGERSLLLEFLQSVAFLIAPKTSEKEASLLEMLNIIAPLGKKGYGVDQLTVDNTDIQKYVSPIKPTKTDESVARRVLSQYIRKQNYAPGTYKMEAAIALLKDVYDYLQGLIEAEIVKYDEGFIVFACQQLELNEGKIEHRKIKAGLQANRRLDYSALDSLKKGMHKDSWMGSAIRLLIHSALKTGMKGNRAPTATDWSRLLGRAVETILVATNYEFITHNLVDIEIKIDENYAVKVEDKDLDVDFGSFSHKDAEKKMSYAVKEFEKANTEQEEIKEEVSQSQEQLLLKETKLDELFMEEFGVKYSNILLVLLILSRRNLPEPTEFPVYVIDRPALLQAVYSNIIIDIEMADIDKTLSFLTLKEGVFSPDKFLYFGAMLRNKERITVCPIIELTDGSLLFGRECIDGSMKIWDAAFQGNFPWVIEQNSNLGKYMKEIRNRNAKWLERKAEKMAVETIGRKYVELNIDNFKRLSPSFNKKEPCGEIDLLCVLQASKTIMVFDCKNLIRVHGLYQAKRNIQDFFTKKDSYYGALLRKKEFVSRNLKEVLHYFDIDDIADWKVKEAFIVTNVHYAAFHAQANVDFIDIDDLDNYLLSLNKVTQESL